MRIHHTKVVREHEMVKNSLQDMCESWDMEFGV